MIVGLDTINLVELVRNSGVELKEHGAKHFGLCPFHADNNPSFYVFVDGHFKCFGCGEYGDAVDFVKKLNGLSFPDALKMLGLHKNELSEEDKASIESKRNRRELAEAFRQWERETADKLATLVRCANKALGSMKTIDDLERYGDIYHSLAFWEHCLFDVLCSGDDQEKYQLFIWTQTHGTNGI